MDQFQRMIKQKLTKRLRDDMDQERARLEMAINKEFKLHSMLSQRETRLQNGVKALEAQKTQLESRETQCDAEEKELDIKLAQLGKDVPPRELVSPGDTWSNQAYNLVAAINAADDLIFSIENDALAKRLCTLKQALESVRSLAKQQFKDKALAQMVFDAQRRQNQMSA